MTRTPAGLLAALCAITAITAITALTGCTGGDDRQGDARRTPAVVPTGSATPSAGEEPPPADTIDVEASEQLLLTSSVRLAVDIDGRRSEVSLPQSGILDSVLEQEAGERKRVLRLNTADPESADGDSFTIEGVMAPGSFKTGEAGLKLIFFSSSLGIDLYSDDGSCTIDFDRADATGAAGSVTCPAVNGEGTRATITGDFTARVAEG